MKIKSLQLVCLHFPFFVCLKTISVVFFRRMYFNIITLFWISPTLAHKCPQIAFLNCWYSDSLLSPGHDIFNWENIISTGNEVPGKLKVNSVQWRVFPVLFFWHWNMWRFQQKQCHRCYTASRLHSRYLFSTYVLTTKHVKYITYI